MELVYRSTEYSYEERSFGNTVKLKDRSTAAFWRTKRGILNNCGIMSIESARTYKVRNAVELGVRYTDEIDTKVIIEVLNRLLDTSTAIFVWSDRKYGSNKEFISWLMGRANSQRHVANLNSGNDICVGIIYRQQMADRIVELENKLKKD